MNRIEFLKYTWWRFAVLIAVTASLPFFYGVENPAGVDPFPLFAALAVMGWIGLIGMMLLPNEARKGFADKYK